MLATSRLRIVVASLVLAVAILGYVTGHGHSAAAVAEKSRSALVGKVAVTAPAHWQPATAAPSIPGLAIAGPAVLAPGGDAAEAGMVSGRLVERAPSPLPAGFLASLPRPPTTEVVNLVEIQAYRYSNLSVPGFDRLLVIYAIPNPGGNPTAVACYASKKHSDDLTGCERIVATLSLVDHSRSYYLTPEPVYAHQVTRAMESLDRQRVLLRGEMHQRRALVNVQRLATNLARELANAHASLALLEPPLVASQANTLLKSSVARAHQAYLALAAAAAAGNASRYDEVRSQVDSSDASIGSALASLALLGYR